ncbi:MAG: MarR family transcriptional regulator [Candidatus Obscuribacterales bacterium]|nr:MarR family transcriptional regulator [Candidatus Obscuribacterales bacterium]
MSKTPPSDLEDHLGYHLRCLSNFVSQSFAMKLAAEDVSVAQWVVMRVLYNQQDISLNEAAEAVGVDNSSLSRMIERLVQKDLVNRKEGKNRRSISLTLTAAGKKLVPKLAKLADENDKAFFGSLTVTQKNDLLKIVQQLLKANGWNVSTHGKNRLE